MPRLPVLGVVLGAPLTVACMSALGVDFDPSLKKSAVGEDAGLGGSEEGTDPTSGETPRQGQDGEAPHHPLGPGSAHVTGETLVAGRDRLGARSTVGFRPWHGGLYAKGDVVYWVESGAQAGLYALPATGAPCTDCATKIASFTRASAFSATPDAIVVGDVTRIVRFPFPIASDAAPEPVASATHEVVNLAAVPSAVFWTSGDDAAIQRTAAGRTSTPIYSNGEPVGMAAAGDRVFWVGVDISGQSGALQNIGQDGKSPAAIGNVNGGFQAIGGNATYLYYARELPSVILRRTVSTGHLETIASDALGVKDFAMTDTYAYWVEPGDGPEYANGRVRRVAHDSATPETIAVSIAMPVAIAVDGARVFVASAGTKAKGRADGAILRFTLED